MGEAEVGPMLEDLWGDIGERDFFGGLGAEFVEPAACVDFED